MGGYRVSSFEESTFADWLVEFSHGSNEGVRNRAQVIYLQRYLCGIGARSMVLEDDYFDRDFLEDFAAFHARCFVGYRRTCVRLHFFKAEVDRASFEARLLDVDERQSLAGSYLGFVVIKPLPDTVIGRSCLAADPNGSYMPMEVPTTRPERANLFGLDLQIDSIPFQEQDLDVAACASSALWTVLNGTSRLFGHSTMSPIMITENAGRGDGRHLPAFDGLTALQMSTAIRSAGLEPYLIGASDVSVLKISAFAYLRLGLPCLLLGQLHAPGCAEPVGAHAVALLGFRRDTGLAASVGGKPRFLASTIGSLSCHDDQVGPFSELKFGTTHLERTGDEERGNVFKPLNLLVPLYHKVRIPIEDVVATAQGCDRVVEALRPSGLFPIPDRLTWDVRLTTVSRLRSEIAALVDDADVRMRLLTRSYPRFIWQLTAADSSGTVFEALFDATDLLQGPQLLDVLAINNPICAKLAAAFPFIAPHLTTRKRVAAVFETLAKAIGYT